MVAERRPQGRQAARRADVRPRSTSAAWRSARATSGDAAADGTVAQTIANGGVRMEPRLVRKIVDPDGRTIDEPQPEEAERVMSRGQPRRSSATMMPRWSRRARARRRRSRASRWPARPARPSSTSHGPQRPVVHRLHRPTSRSRSWSSACRAARAATVAAPIAKAGAGGARASDRCSGDRARHDRRRPLPGPHRHRLGRDGRRLLRRGHAARPPRRAEAPAPPLRRGPGVRRALPPRGARAPPACSTPTSSASSTAASGTAPTTSRWSSSRAARSSSSSASTARCRPTLRDRHHRAGPARRALRPQARHHPPRHQAAQRDRRRRGPRQGHGLRHRPRRRLGHDGDRLDHGHRAVPVARAGPGAAGQPALGPLLDRRHALRAADGPRARSTAESRGDDRAQAGLRGARRRRAELNPAVSPGARGRRAARAGEGPGAALRRRRRVHRRARGGARPARRAVSRRDACSEPYPMPGEPFAEPRSADALALVAVAAGRCSLLAALASAPTCCSRRSRTPCPTWSASASAVAAQRLHNAGFEVNIETVELRRRAQGPRRHAGAAARRGGRGGLDGDDHRVQRPGRGDRPGVLGRKQDVAENMLKEAGFKTDVAQGDLRHRRAGPRDQHVAAGDTQLEKGRTVDAGRLQRARAGRRCPTSSATSEDAARNTLEDAGLTVDVLRGGVRATRTRAPCCARRPARAARSTRAAP